VEPAGQTVNHIVLRLARDTGTRSTERWQILSVSDQVNQKVSTGKCRKVSRRKPKLLLTVRRPDNAVKQRIRGKGGKKKKNSADSASVLNNTTVPECGVSSDSESRVIRQKACKHKKVLSEDCCSFCSVTNARGGAVTRKSRTARVLHKDSLKENFDAKVNSNISVADDIEDKVTDKGNFTAGYKVNCTSSSCMVSKTLLTGEEESRQCIDSCQDTSVYNGMLGGAGDSVKIGKRRKTMPMSESSKHCCRETDRLSETNAAEAGKTADVTSVCESDDLNSDVNCNRMLVSRRARPVKNRKLMNNCYVFSLLVKTTRRRKVTGKQPGPEAVVNPQCTVTCSSEASSGQMENASGIVNVTNETVMTEGDKLTFPVTENKATSCTSNKSDIMTEYTENSCASTLCEFDDFCEGATQSSVSISEHVFKPNADILNTISDTTCIPHEESDIKVANDDNTLCVLADDCKYVTNETVITEGDNLTCSVTENNETSCTSNKSDIMTEYTENSSASTLCELDLLDEFCEGAMQYSVPGSVHVLKPNPDVLNTISDTTCIVREESDMKVADDENTSYVLADDCKYNILNCDTVADKDISTAASNGSPVLSHLKDESVSESQFPTMAENICYDFDHLIRTDDIKVATEKLETESVPSAEVNVDFCRLDGSRDSSEIQHTHNEMCNTLTEHIDGLVPVPAANENIETHVECDMLAVDASNTDADKPTSDKESDCLLPESAGDDKICMDLCENLMDSASATVPERVDKPRSDMESDWLLPQRVGDDEMCADVHENLMDSASATVAVSVGDVEIGTDVCENLMDSISIAIAESMGDDEICTDVHENLMMDSASVDIAERVNKSRSDMESDFLLPESVGNDEICHDVCENLIESAPKDIAESAGDGEICADVCENLTDSAPVTVAERVDKPRSDMEYDWLLPESTGDGEICADVHENLMDSAPIDMAESAGDVETCADVRENLMDSAPVDVAASVDCEVTEFVKDDSQVTSAAGSGLADATDVQLLQELACDCISETVETFNTDEQGNMASESSDRPCSKPDFISVCDVELDVNASEINRISHNLVVSSTPMSRVTDEFHDLDCYVVTAPDTNSPIIVQSIQLPAVSSVTATETSLPVKPTNSRRRRRCRRITTRRNQKVRRKRAGKKTGNDLNHNSGESSADLFSGEVCREDKCEQLTVNELTNDVHKVRRKSSEGDLLEEVQDAGIKTRSDTAARRKHQDASSRLFHYTLIVFIMK